MSDWFLEDENVEYIDESKGMGFDSPLYQFEETWMDREWVQKVIDFLISPSFIVSTIIICSIALCIFGGYNA